MPNQPTKPALGRGLEDLLAKSMPAAEGEGGERPPAAPQPVTLSAGFRTLLNANQTPSPPPAADPPQPPSSGLGLPASLIGADLLFIVLACRLMLTAGPLVTNCLLSGLALALGAWLSILALWTRSGK